LGASEETTKTQNPPGPHGRQRKETSLYFSGKHMNSAKIKWQTEASIQEKAKRRRNYPPNFTFRGSKKQGRGSTTRPLWSSPHQTVIIHIYNSWKLSQNENMQPPASTNNSRIHVQKRGSLAWII